MWKQYIDLSLSHFLNVLMSTYFKRTGLKKCRHVFPSIQTSPIRKSRPKVISSTFTSETPGLSSPSSSVLSFFRVLSLSDLSLSFSLISSILGSFSSFREIVRFLACAFFLVSLIMLVWDKT